eukprot:5581994-Amphidinium_carterae.2
MKTAMQHKLLYSKSVKKLAERHQKLCRCCQEACEGSGFSSSQVCDPMHKVEGHVFLAST